MAFSQKVFSKSPSHPGWALKIVIPLRICATTISNRKPGHAPLQTRIANPCCRSRVQFARELGSWRSYQQEQSKDGTGGLQVKPVFTKMQR
jgi:hypothetical protein